VCFCRSGWFLNLGGDDDNNDDDDKPATATFRSRYFYRQIHARTQRWLFSASDKLFPSPDLAKVQMDVIGCFEGVPLVAEVTWEGPLITVAEPDVDLQSCQSGAGHVTEGTLHLIY